MIAGKSANTAFSYYCDLRSFSRFMKRRRGLVEEDADLDKVDPNGLDTAFWASITKEDIYEYLYFLNQERGNKKSSTARRLASLHGFYDYLTGFMIIWSTRSIESNKILRQRSARPNRTRYCLSI